MNVHDSTVRRVADHTYSQIDTKNISGIKGIKRPSDTSSRLLNIDSFLLSNKNKTVEEVARLWREKDSIGKSISLSDLKSKYRVSNARPFISAPTGYISYHSNYRSNIDTPVREKDFLQHQLISRTSVTFFNAVPLQVFTLFRRSNSSFFSDINDVQVQLDVNQFQKNLLQQWTNKSQISNPYGGEQAFLTSFYNNKINQANQLQHWVNHPAQLQKLVECNEILLKLKDTGNLYKDSIAGFFSEQQLADNESRLTGKADTLKAGAVRYIKFYDSVKLELELRKSQADSIQKIYRSVHEKYELFNALLKGNKNTPEAMALLASNKGRELLSNQEMPSYIRHLYGIRSFAVGRTQADYSELSVKDISIKGINFEYNSWYYVAVTAGKIDYRFRDFQAGNMQTPRQDLYMLRLGIGRKEKNYIIGSVFKGRRQRYGNTELSTGQYLPDNVMGITLESKWQFSPNAYIIGEIGKSNNPFQPNERSGSKSNAAFDFSDETSLAYSLKAYGYIPQTQTLLLATFRKLGARYQSFRNYNVNAATQAWNIRAEQHLWKRRIRLIAGVRTNDFSSPFANFTYKTNSLFWTMQGAIAIKRLPAVSVGYMPSSLISVIDNKLVETFNQVLQVTSNYMYKLGTSKAYSSVFYTRLFNEQSDSALIHYNAKSFLLNQGFVFKYFTANISGSHHSSPNYKLNVIGCSVTANNNTHNRSISFGTKINELDNDLIRIGFNAAATLRTKKAGDFQLFFEQGWLPAYRNELIKNDMATISYTKTF